ncbi:unnamed protein product [Clonostachys rhizophaga]|uniref:Uncharacterized protein n=1 Tax=Clonostachys rhizophaga TaxID=160324 RepID=A0A9N9VHM8_9HYPO|nr:unnamed protein product [Clonostachys rhizophaga]
MRFSLAAAAAALAATAQARISGISVPETIKPGDTVDLKIISENYIQRVDDVAIAYGYATTNAYPGTLTNLLGSFYLGPDESNLPSGETVVKTVTFPADIAKGPGFVTAGAYSLYGASKTTTIVNYNVSITFGDETSTTYKNSF